MGHFLRTCLAIAALLGAYAFAFGLPFGNEGAQLPDTQAAPTGRGPGRGGAGRPGGGGGGRETVAVLETVEVTPYSQRITALGTAQSRASVALVAEVSGRITALSLPADRQVAEGAALVTLDSEREAAELRIAEAELARTTDALDRYETLAASNSGAVQASALSEARAAQQTAQARLELARIALDERVIRAPISGRASLSDLSVGQSLSSGDAVTTIDDTARLVVSFELPEKALDLLDIGTTIEARAPARPGEVYVARISAIDSRVDPVTRGVALRAEIDNAQGNLRPGTALHLSVAAEGEALPVVPETALGYTAQGIRVWEVEDGLARERSVLIRARQDDRVWVEADLQTGATVVADGATRLREGAAVTDLGVVGAEPAPRGSGVGPAPTTRRAPDAQDVADETVDSPNDAARPAPSPRPEGRG